MNLYTKRKYPVNNIFLSEDCDSNCGCGYHQITENLDGEGKDFSFPGQGVENCAEACNQRSGCTSFEYNHGGNENYKCGTYNGGNNNIVGTQLEQWTSCIKGSNKASCYESVIFLSL